MSVKEIGFRLSVIDDFSKNLDKLTSGIDDVKSGAEKLNKFGSGMGKYVTAPILGAVTAVGGMATAFAKTGDAVAKTSKKLGISTDAYQELDYWSSQNGISQAVMEQSIGRLNQRIGDAINGSDKYAESFENLGVAITDSNGKIRGTDEVLNDTISSLMGIEDSSLRSSMAADVFGTKVARELLPALEDGSLSIDEAAKKAAELGIIMDEDAVKGSEEFMDAMDDLTRSFKSAFLPIAVEAMNFMKSELFPVIQDKVIPALQNFGKRIGELIEWFNSLDSTQQKTILTIVAVIAAIGPAIKIITVLIGVVKALAVGIAFLTSPIGLAIAAIAAIIAIGVLLWRNWDTVTEKASQLWTKIKDIFNRIKNAVSDRITDVWTTVTDTFNRIISFIFGLNKSFREAGKGLISNLIGGIKGMAKKAVDTVKGVASSIRNLLPFSPAKDGPLSDLDKLDFAGPITSSIDKGMPKIQTEMSHALEVPSMNVRPMQTTRASDHKAKQAATQPRRELVSLEIPLTVDGREIARASIDDINALLSRAGSTTMRVAGIKR